jgi:hypothetical protein
MTDRSIPPGEPTPARLIPMHDPATVVTDLVNAVGQGINNAAALFGSPPPLKVPRDTSTLTAFGGAEVNDGSVVGSPGKVADLTDLNALGDGISHSLRAPNRFRSEWRNNQLTADGETSGPQALRGWTKLTPRSLTDGLKFTPAKPTSSTGDNQTGGPAAKTGANVNDTVQRAADNVKRTVRNATEGVTSGLKHLNRHNADSKTGRPGR